jgi:hypothetical protein
MPQRPVTRRPLITLPLFLGGILTACGMLGRTSLPGTTTDSECPTPGRFTLTALAGTAGGSAVVRGIVVAEEDEQPVPWSAIRTVQSGRGRVDVVSVDSTARFRIQLVPGTYVLTAGAVGYADRSTDRIVLRAGSEWALQFYLGCIPSVHEQRRFAA